MLTEPALRDGVAAGWLEPKARAVLLRVRAQEVAAGLTPEDKQQRRLPNGCYPAAAAERSHRMSASSSGGEPRRSHVPSVLRTTRPLSLTLCSAVVIEARREPKTLAEELVGQSQPQTDPVGGYPAPPFRQVPEKHEQSRLHG